MKAKGIFKTVLVVSLCICLNYIGKDIGLALKLPLWLDSFGTVIAAYLMGPVCGSIVGVAGNVMHGFVRMASLLYAFTSVAIGVVVGIASRRRKLDTLFGASSAAVLVTLVSVAVSVPVNCIFYGGMTGNVWGDGVIEYFREQGAPAIVCVIAGQFYLDFLDKITTVVSVCAGAKLVRVVRERKKALRQKHESKEGIPASIARTLVLLCLFFPVLSVQQAYAGAFDSYIQTVYSSENGLSCGEANDVVQTPDGILWIATYAGLYRYNGSSFRLMQDFSSVRNANCLYVDVEGRLWIGTNDCGLSICINERVVNVVDHSSGLPSDSVRCITRGTDGIYYAGTTGGMIALALGSGMKMLGPVEGVGLAWGVSSGPDGFVSAVTDDGALCLINNAVLVDRVTLSNGGEYFSCCTFSPDGLIYAGTSSGNIYLYRITQDGGQPCLKRVGAENLPLLHCPSFSTLRRILFASGDVVLVCSDNGIGYFDGAWDFHRINTGSFSSFIDNVTVDYQGNCWFTSSRRGLLRLSDSPVENIYRTTGMVPSVTNTVTWWNHSLYVGTDSGLDIIRNGHGIKNGLTEFFSGVRIRCLFTGSDGTLWVCTYGKGLFPVKSADDKSLVAVPGAGEWVRMAAAFPDGTIAACSDAGIVYISDGTVRHTVPYHTALGGTSVLCLLPLDSHTLLAGTDGDGIALLRDGNVTRIFSAGDGLPSSVVLRLVRDVDGTGTFVVTSNSLCYLDGDFNLKLLDNFPYYNNYDLWQEDSRLFVLGSAGIHVVEKDDLLSGKTPLLYELLDAKTGLTSPLTANAWNCFCRDGVSYLSCSAGVFSLDTSRFRAGKKSYRMMVSSIALDGTPYKVYRSLPFSIPRATEKIEIFPEVVNYTTVDPTVRYWLEGFDSKPTEILQSSLSSITYSNLPSGNYTFRIAVLDGPQGAVLEQSNYQLIKEKRIHDNKYFIVYFVAVGMLAVAWFTWCIVRTQIQNTLAMQKKELEFARAQMENLKLFAKFTNTAVAEAISTKTIDFSPHLKDCTVLFSDIRGFTAISDGFSQRFGRNSAAKIITFLNDYMSRMVNCIASTGGTVDKFEGDAIMAVWGMMRKDALDYEKFAENDQRRISARQEHLCNLREDALACIRTALAMRCALMEYNALAASDKTGTKPKIRIGCGINSGRVTAGFMGGEQKLEYTAIGDAVNLASRTETASKFCGADILITEYTYSLVRFEGIVVEPIPVTINVKGKGERHFFALVNMPSLDLREFFDVSTLTVGLHAAGPYGPKTLAQVRKMLDIPEPDYEKMKKGDQKVAVRRTDT